MHTFARFRRLIVPLAITLLLAIWPAAPLVAQASSAPVDWAISVGASSADQSVQANFYRVRQIWIHVNDKITFTWQSGEIHTVSFLSGQPPSWPGGPFAPTGGPNPSYNGTGQISSGIEAMGFGGPYTVTFTRAGSYTFNCLVHSTMHGTVNVLPASQDLPHSDPAFYTQQAQNQKNTYLTEGQNLQQEGLNRAMAAGPLAVNAGFGKLLPYGSFAILRFQPQQRWVHVGDTVTWTDRDPETPHTVTFGVEVNPDMRVPASGLAVIGAGFNPATQTISSGIISNESLAPLFTFRGPTFQVKFTATGDYSYRCELHDDLGMTGTIHVR